MLAHACRDSRHVAASHAAAKELCPASPAAHTCRFTRHDILAELFGGVAAYQAAAARLAAGAAGAGAAAQRGRLAAAAAALRDVSVFDYKNVALESIQLSKFSGAHFVVRAWACGWQVPQLVGGCRRRGALLPGGASLLLSQWLSLRPAPCPASFEPSGDI